MKEIAKKIYHSPTFNTWFSYSSKALGLFAFTPLILKSLSVEEIALWYLFLTILVLQGIIDMGFRFTFIRYISYTKGGATHIPAKNEKFKPTGNSDPNYELMGRIYSLMKKVYFYLSIVLLVVMITIGSLSLEKQINLTQHVFDSWLAWGMIIFTTIIKFYGSIFQIYLEGNNKIAIVRRVEGFMNIGSSISGILVLYYFENLLYLVITIQGWTILNVIRNRILMYFIDDKQFGRIKTNYPFDKDLFQKTWGPAWRTGVSSIMSNSLTSILSILYAQIADSKELASYMLSLRYLTQVKDISVAPFYTKLPSFAMLYSQGKIEDIKKVAQRGMLASNLVFIVGSIGLVEMGYFLISILDSDVQFVDRPLWILLIIAFFVHRFGAMHVHLYQVGNHIISHIADGVSGAIFILTTLFLFEDYKIYAIPIGMLAGYLGFYSWFASYRSYKLLNENFFSFERKANLLPISILFVYIFVTLFLI